MIRNLMALAFCLPFITFAQDEADPWREGNFTGLQFRSIGPAFMSGRIADIAIHPDDESIWYVAVGSGGLWKTHNNGISWQSIFDNQSSYSTGCVSLDPNNPNIIWLGTGENVGGRHVGFGDGIYRSTDGGVNWQNMGLKSSEHISKIIIHPDNSNIIWVAAQGPLWSAGGDRGVYKSTDGGETWRRMLGDDQWVGATDICLDPRNPERLYAATWQRHRTVAAYLGGGPGSGIYRSEDGGDTWQKLEQGLPKSNLGKTGLALSPQNPDVLYAALELDHRSGGLYRSTDRGHTWHKQSDAISGGTGPHYYQELYASPHREGRLYLMDVRTQVSEDGGKNFQSMKEEYKHSDNHAIAFKKSDPNYLLVGTDGGLYESYDLGENWRFISNMPITQFYKLAVDDTEPFYNIYGGTQDNSTQGGPSRTDNPHGIQNSDWEIILNWDGHQPATEPGNPNIVYGQRQQGTLSRIDMATGEVTDIQPQPAADEDFERFNWDAPILVSSHKPSRVYFASQRLWRSENRGDSWEAISGDLTRNQERIEQPIMGRQQSWDNAWDLYAMSTFNTITAIGESPLNDQLLYTGTDDGFIQVTEDAGANWRAISLGKLPEAPANAYVNDIKPDLFDENTVYVALDNHKNGDFKPYLYKSTNRGKTWQSISSNLPDRHLVWRLVQDHQDKNLLFIGTEFGLFFSPDGGEKWVPLKGGLPTIAFRDLTIQRREDDLVAASFGRSIYVFDDLAVFRHLGDSIFNREGSLFPVRKTWWYVPNPQLSFSGKKGAQGAAHYVADNPPFGAVFTYYLKNDYPTAAEKRKEREKKLAGSTANIPFAGWDSLSAEYTETGTQLWLCIMDQAGRVIRKVPAASKKGFHRTAWDLRHASPRVVEHGQKGERGSGMWVSPGTYQVRLQKEDRGKITDLSEPQKFELVPLYRGSLSNPLASKRDEFWRSYDALYRRFTALDRAMNSHKKYLQSIEVAYNQAGIQEESLLRKIREVHDDLNSLEEQVEGNIAKRKVGEKTRPTIGDRMFALSRILSNSTYGPTHTALQTYEIADKELAVYQAELDNIEGVLKTLAEEISQSGGPFIEGF